MNNQIIPELNYEQIPSLKAMNLAERVNCIPKDGGNLRMKEGEILDEIVANWKNLNPFSEEGVFAQRLAVHGISEEDLSYYADSNNSFSFSNEPAWMNEIRSIWKSFDPNKDPVSFPKELRDRWQGIRFLEIFQPYLQYAYTRFLQGLATLSQEYSIVPFEREDMERAFLLNVPPPLIWAVSRTLVLELHVARLEGTLLESTPEGRFEEFLTVFQHPSKLLELLEEYPVLARLISTLFCQWPENVLEFLTNLCRDWEQIQTEFAIQSEERLKKIQVGAGDRHRNGRSVIIAEFSSEARLVYKPRSLAVDEQFQHLLVWLNKNNKFVSFRPLKLINCGSHGWVEFVKSHPCETSKEIKQFYTRQGAYLSLLYALGATDFHFENVIAEGEHPVLIDLETLFSPLKEEDASYTLPAHSLLTNSVMSVGLLPHRVWTEGQSEGVDISGLGMQEGQLTPSPLPIWEKINTDEMYLSRARRPLSGNTHQPTVGGQKVNVLDHKSEIIEGFTSMYRVLLKLRDKLTAQNGPLDKFANTEIRFLLRPTRVYSLLLQESLHPDLMQDALDLDQHFDRLWMHVYQHNSFRSAVSYEHADLWRFDVPIFTTLSSSTHLWTSTNEVVEDFFEKSGLEQAKYKLSQLSETDLELQRWLIETALATMGNIGGEESRKTLYKPNLFASPPATVDKEKLLDEAIGIGARLHQTAIQDSKHVSWLGVKFVEGRNYWSIVPLDISLYRGLPGIALFLAYLGEITGDDAHTNLAKKTVKTIFYCIDNELFPLSDIGMFEGWGGVIYLLAHLGVLWQDESLVKRAEAIADSLENLIADDEKFDIISGAAGCIGAICTLYSVTNQTKLLNLGRKCGDHLLKSTVESDEDIVWLQQGLPMIDRPLTGFSHGIAGIAWALTQLSLATNDAQYGITAQKSLAYERKLFSESAQNWPDLRNFSMYGVQLPDGPAHLSFWCHGAPGIGLARLATLKNTGAEDSLARGEVDVAYRTTLSQGFGHGHCLCHGDFGSLEFLNEANSYLGLQESQQVNALIQGVLDSVKKHGWLCGNGLHVEEPGLMTGLAGIGYQLLRLTRPDVVPSVLTLEPPKLVSSHP